MYFVRSKCALFVPPCLPMFVVCNFKIKLDKYINTFFKNLKNTTGPFGHIFLIVDQIFLITDLLLCCFSSDMDWSASTGRWQIVTATVPVNFVCWQFWNRIFSPSQTHARTHILLDQSVTEFGFFADVLCPLCSFQDIPGACSITDLHDALSLSEVGDRRLFLIGTHVRKGEVEPSSGVQDARELITQMVWESK